ncbi:hypothetical protein [Pimelobacter simplex]|uniref:hypothetical protein n=1 Tax=Nocardioides simplex TaxID=2045 RepID=UPI003AAC157B
MSRPLRTALALAVATLTVATAAGTAPAYAGSQHARDRARDVRTLVDEGQRGTPARNDSARDLLSADARFAKKRLVVSVRFRNLRSSGFVLFTDVRTPTGRYRVQYDAESTRPFVTVHTIGGATSSCRTTAVRANPRTDRVRVVLPRICIGGGKATWAKFGALALHERADGRFAVDDLRRADRVDVSATGIKLGPRIRYN